MKTRFRSKYSPHNPSLYGVPEQPATRSRTKQSFKDSCDINNILARYQRTGVIDHVAKYQPQYGELDGCTYHEHMTQIAKANSMFEELPSTVRFQFGNDPAAFLDYVNEIDEDKLRWMAKNGLVTEIREQTTAHNRRQADKRKNDPQNDPEPQD